MASKNNCAGCMNIIKSKEYLQCSTCNLRYDLLCSNISDKKFKTMKVVDKATWKCQDCRSKLPKTNNTDTPVRTTKTESPKHSPKDTNVTMRSKRPHSPLLSPVEDDLVVSSDTSQKKNNSPNTSANTTTTSSPITEEGTVLKITQSSFRQIIRQEIGNALKEVVAEQFKQINDLISGFRTSLEFFNEKYEEVKVNLEQNSSKLQAVEGENIKLRTCVQDLTKRINLMEQHNRVTNIELQNVPENRSENLITTVLQLSSITKCQIEDTDIAYCARIAKKDTQTARPRSILVKFNTPRLRDSFLAAAINFNKDNKNNKLNTSHLGIAAENPTPIYVVEHLSADNKALHAAARVRGKELGYKFVWVRNGRVFMKKNDQAERIVITCQEVLKSIS